MVTHTAAEARAHNISLMGGPLGEVYSALWQELVWVHANWAEYEVLFGSKPSRVELVNEAAPYFFRLVQDTLWDSALLHIARLTDRENPGRPVLTIQRLPSLITDTKLKASVADIVDVAIRDTKFCRDWRNRHIAHRDLDLSLNNQARPLASASRLQVNAALQSLANVLNEVALHYKDGQTAFDFHSVSDGAETLLYVLHAGVASQKARIERMKNRTAGAEDWAVPEL